MILIVTEQGDLSADLVVEQLERRGQPFVRLNSDSLLSDAHLTFEEPCGVVRLTDEAGSEFDLRRIKAIWYRRAVVPRVVMDKPSSLAEFAGRESLAHLQGALFSLQAYWMSRPEAIWRANHKLLQLQTARSLGLTIPDTIVTASPDRAWAFVRRCSGHVIAKPVSYGLIRAGATDQAVYTTRLPEGLARTDFDTLCASPVIFQEEIVKRCDIRATIIGRRVFAAAIESQDVPGAEVDWRRSTTGALRHRAIMLPQKLTDALLRMMEVLGLEFGAVDLVERRDGTHVFLEVNPNGQWGWIQLATGLELAAEIAQRLSDAAQA